MNETMIASDSIFYPLDSFGQRLIDGLDKDGRMHLSLQNNLYAGTLPSFIQHMKQHQFAIDAIIIVYWSGCIYLHAVIDKSYRACNACCVASLVRNLSYAAPRVSELHSANIYIPDDFTLTQPQLNLLASILDYNIIKQSFKSGAGTISYKLSDETVTNNKIQQDVECPVCISSMCSSIPDLATRPIDTPYSNLRYHALAEYDATVESLSESTIGYVSELANDLQLPVASSCAQLILSQTRHEMTLGRSTDFKSSKAIAVLESLERLCGMQGFKFVDIYTAAYNELSNVNAINPTRYCLHSNEQYELNSFPFRSFDSDLPLNWVEGLNISTNSVVYVPASMAFYGYKHDQQHQMLAFETSNGCALGANTIEATLSGILEIIERDAFLRTWYMRTPLKDISKQVIKSTKVSQLYAKVRLFCQADIFIFDSTQGHGIPTVFALAVSNKPGKAKFAAAAGVGLTLINATESALYELSCSYIRLQYEFAQQGTFTKANDLFDDSMLVMSMDDHALVNAIPRAEQRYQFLLDCIDKNNKICNAETEINYSKIAETTPYGVLNDITATLRKLGHDIVVIDQTIPFMKDRNISCVKVMISDLLPITFGHRYARIETSTMENSSVKLTLDNILPHPFP